MLSVIIPSYNEESTVETAASVIGNILKNAEIECELLFVDDGSNDLTWEIIEGLCEKYEYVRGIHFSRNFGKEAAVLAGLTESHGDCCAVIDCDLQHPPEKLVEMYRLWESGYEIVEGQKENRGAEKKAYSIAAKCFYSVISAACGFDMSNASDFKLLDRKAVNVLVNMREKNAFFRAMSSWVGFKTAHVKFDVRERVAGKTKWTTFSLIKYALGNITSFSTAPMQLVTALGVIMFVITVVLGIITLVQKLSGVAVEGFTTVILIQLFSGSATMISLGIIGYYISKIYEEIKGRPRYIISEKSGFESEATE